MAEAHAIRNDSNASNVSNDSNALVAKLGWFVFLVTMVAMLILGYWIFHTDPPFEAGDDIGYNLGLVGGLMMLTLLLYPLRKRVGFMKKLGRMPKWFKWHMVFGILGPVLILFHTTFRVGSFNDAIALLCMTLVAGSGVFGRFFYSKIHHGLYGRQASLREIEERMAQRGQTQSAIMPGVAQRLAAFRARFANGNALSFGEFVMVGVHAVWLRLSLKRELKQALRAACERGELQAREVAPLYARRMEKLSGYLQAVCDVARFQTWQRLFSWWHVLHIPLVFMLALSSVFHVLSVHMY